MIKEKIEAFYKKLGIYRILTIMLVPVLLMILFVVIVENNSYSFITAHSGDLFKYSLFFFIISLALIIYFLGFEAINDVKNNTIINKLYKILSWVLKISFLFMIYFGAMFLYSESLTTFQNNKLEIHIKKTNNVKG